MQLQNVAQKLKEPSCPSHRCVLASPRASTQWLRMAPGCLAWCYAIPWMCSFQASHRWHMFATPSINGPAKRLPKGEMMRNGWGGGGSCDSRCCTKSRWWSNRSTRFAAFVVLGGSPLIYHPHAYIKKDWTRSSFRNPSPFGHKRIVQWCKVFLPRRNSILGSTISRDRTSSGTSGNTCIVEAAEQLFNFEAPRKARPRRLATGEGYECGQALWGKCIAKISRP